MQGNVPSPPQHLFKLSIDHASPFALLDTQGRYLYVNRSWEAARGLTMEQVYMRQVDEIVTDTSAMLAIRERRVIVGHPVTMTNVKGEFLYTTYTPLYQNGSMVALSIQTIFGDFEQAVRFSEAFNKMHSERNYYRQEVRRLQGAHYSLENIVGVSPLIQEVKKQIQQASQSMSTVLIEGETGTGKELVAHALHDLGPRAVRPFIKVNCAAIPEELAESELFGYEYGAFTGAAKGGRTGRFEMAEKGSLFLDEINQLSAITQPKLLRVLQEREIERVGGGKSIPVDVRLIAATNVPLKDLVREGSFRSDLFYRLNVINIRIPALRERLEDLPLLCENIIEKLNAQLGMKISGISNEAMQLLQGYSWPGNIRELQNVIERAMNMRLNGVLIRTDFADFTEYKLPASMQPVRAGEKGTYRQVKGQLEMQMIQDALESCHGNKKKAAERLGISRTLLYRKLKQYGMEQ